MTEAYHTYQQLVERVEALARDIRQRYPTQITCHVACVAVWQLSWKRSFCHHERKSPL